MKGEASPESISGLEDLFEFNRDNGKIKQMRKDVENVRSYGSPSHAPYRSGHFHALQVKTMKNHQSRKYKHGYSKS